MFLKINYIFLTVLTTFLYLFCVSAQNNTKTDGVDCKNRKTTERLDIIFAKLYTFGDSGRSFPLNSAEALVYCNETSELLKSAEYYVKNCLKEYPKRMLSILIKTVRTQSKTLCTQRASKRLQELFLSADCTNAAKSQYQKCINDSVDVMIGIRTVDDKQKLPLLCCGVHRMQKCFHDESLKVGDICNEDKVEKSLRFLDSIQGNMISILCTRYDESSDTCDKLVYPRRTKKQKRNQSIVLPMIRILDSIKDEKARGI